MANVKISALPAATSVASADVLPIVQSATTKKATIQNVSDALGVTTTVAGSSAGLVYVAGTSFSSATEVIVDNCFTSAYDNYQIILDLDALSGGDDIILFQWRTGGGTGSTYGTTNYDYQLVEFFSTSVSASSTLANNWHRLGYAYQNPGYFSAVVNIINPYAARRAQFSCDSSTPNGTSYILKDQISGANRVTTSFTGIRIGNYAGNRQMTGRVRIYGYRNV